MKRANKLLVDFLNGVWVPFLRFTDEHLFFLLQTTVIKQVVKYINGMVQKNLHAIQTKHH